MEFHLRLGGGCGVIWGGLSHPNPSLVTSLNISFPIIMQWFYPTPFLAYHSWPTLSKNPAPPLSATGRTRRLCLASEVEKTCILDVRLLYEINK